MTRLLFSIATALTTILIVQKIDEGKNSESDIITDNTDNNLIETTENPHPLKRGDRFTCPNTGEQLQVRAVGGRPRKQEMNKRLITIK